MYCGEGKEEEETNPTSAALTIVFIYLPSFNVMACIFGPRTAGSLGMVWGLVIGVAGGMLWQLSETRNMTMIGQIFVFLGFATFFLAYKMNAATIYREGSKNGFSGLKTWMMEPLRSFDLIPFPMLVPFSPFIFILIKILALLQPSNELLNSQSNLGNSGELTLESAPQLTLQFFEVISEMTISWEQWYSITTSALSLSLLTIEQYVTERSEEYGNKAIMENILVFSTASLFKTLSFAILILFYGWGIVVIMFFCIVGYALCTRCLAANRYKVGVRDLKEEEGDDMIQKYSELYFHSWLAFPSLEPSKPALVYAMVTTFYWTIAYTVMLVVILYYCNDDPSVVVTEDWTEAGLPNWPELPLVQDISTLNLVLCSTICLGVMALVFDGITAAVKFYCCRPSYNSTEDHDDEVSFWSGAILLEGLKFKKG